MNSKIRKQIEAKNAETKLLDAYKKKADLMLNYQMCKAYFKDSALSISAIVERILKIKYNLPWQDKIIRKAILGIKGVKNATLVIPQFKYEEKVHDILAKFVERNFGKMVVDSKTNRGLYPLTLMDIIERNS